MQPALLVIDLQRWFLEVGPPEKLTRVVALLGATNALIGLFRERGWPVVRVETVHQADGSTWNQWMKAHNTPRLIEGTWEAEWHPDLDTAETDLVVRKTRHSAFIRTDLEARLRGLGADTVVITGFATDACVGLTTIDAYERDFHILLAEDAILGTNLEQGRKMLDYLQRRFAIEPVSGADIREMLS